MPLWLIIHVSLVTKSRSKSTWISGSETLWVLSTWIFPAWRELFPKLQSMYKMWKRYGIICLWHAQELAGPKCPFGLADWTSVVKTGVKATVMKAYTSRPKYFYIKMRFNIIYDLGYTIHYSFNKVIILHVYNSKLIFFCSQQLENYNKCNTFAVMISRNSGEVITSRSPQVCKGGEIWTFEFSNTHTSTPGLIVYTNSFDAAALVALWSLPLIIIRNNNVTRFSHSSALDRKRESLEKNTARKPVDFSCPWHILQLDIEIVVKRCCDVRIVNR